MAPQRKGRSSKLVEYSAGVDDEGLAGGGVGAAELDDLTGDVVFVGGALQDCSRNGRLAVLGR